MNILSGSKFDIFLKTLKLINSEYSKIIRVFGGNVNSYISSTDNPFNINVNINDVVKFVDENFIDITVGINTVFKSVLSLNNMMENFGQFYASMREVLNNPEKDEDSKTTVVALVLIFVNNNNNKTVAAKKIQSILNSMCVQPTVGALMQVSNDVLNDGLLVF